MKHVIPEGNNKSTQAETQLETRLNELESKLAQIVLRNQLVEREKAWEISWCRKAFIIVVTYFLCSVVFWIIGVDYFLLNAIIPTLGYFLSTLSLPIVKRWWLDRRT